MSFYKSRIRSYLLYQAGQVSPTFASLHLQSSLTVDVNATIVGDVSAANVVASVGMSMASLTTTGAATIGTTLDVTGAATVGTTLGVTGDATLSANASVGGLLSLASGAAGGLKVGADTYFTRGAAGALHVGASAGGYDGKLKCKEYEANTLDAGTNDVVRPIMSVHTTTGLAAAGFGTGYSFFAENASGTESEIARIDAIYTDTVVATMGADIVFYPVSSVTGVASFAERLRLTNLGVLKSYYNSTNANSAEEILVHQRNTTGAAVVGIGIDEVFKVENAAGNAATTATWRYTLTDVTNGAEYGKVELYVPINNSQVCIASFDAKNDPKWSFYGGINQISVTDLLISDKTATFNDGGLAGSGGGCGILIEENAAITAYWKQNAGRTGWELTSSAAPTRILSIITPTAASESLTMSGSLDVELDSVINQDLSSDSATAAFAALNVSAAGGLLLGTASSAAGLLKIANAANAFLINVTGTATAADKNIAFPDASGTVAVSASGAMNLSAAGDITADDAVADGATKGVAAFNATNFSAAVGVVNTIQGISAAATPEYAGLTLTGAQTGTTATFSGAVQGLVQTQLDIINATADTGALIVEDCEAGDAAAWTESHDTFWDIADDAVTYKVGTGSLKFTCSGTAADNDVCYLPTASFVWTDIDRVGFWIRPSIALDGGDILLYCYDGAGGTTTNELSLGALVANTWVYLSMDISGFVKGDIDRVGFSLSAAGAAKAFYVNVDNIAAWDETYTTALTQVPLLGGWRGTWQFGDLAADNHTSVAVAENTDFIQDYSATKKFVPLTDYSGKVLFLNYCYD